MEEVVYESQNMTLAMFFNKHSLHRKRYGPSINATWCVHYHGIATIKDAELHLGYKGHHNRLK